MSPLRSGDNSLWWDLAPVRWMFSLYVTCLLLQVASCWNASLWGCFHTWFDCLVRTWVRFHILPKHTLDYLGPCYFCILFFRVHHIQTFGADLNQFDIRVQFFKCKTHDSTHVEACFNIYSLCSYVSKCLFACICISAPSIFCMSKHVGM